MFSKYSFIFEKKNGKRNVSLYSLILSTGMQTITNQVSL